MASFFSIESSPLTIMHFNMLVYIYEKKKLIDTA